MAKSRRIVFHLADGRRKYATHNGEIEEWSSSDILALKSNINRYGYPVYSLDLKRFYVKKSDFVNEFTFKRMLHIVKYSVEDYCDEPTEGIII